MSPKTDDHAGPAPGAGPEDLGEDAEGTSPQDDARARSSNSEASGGDGSATDETEARADGAAPSEGNDPGTGAAEASGKSRENLEREVADLNDRHLRLAAEFENYRKRVRTEKRETWVRAQADLVRRLVESVDDLQRVALLDPDTSSVQDIVQGVDLVERNMLRTLEEAGLEVLDPAGEDFDPQVMEAVMTAPASSEEEDDTVGQVLQRGYVLQGRLVRPARVSVRKRG